MSLDNINFNKYRQDQCLYNKCQQVVYNIKYICFTPFKGNHERKSNWQLRYLHANQINYGAANKFGANNFFLGENDLKHYKRSVYLILLNNLDNYFSQELDKQKPRRKDGCYLSKYMK